VGGGESGGGRAGVARRARCCTHCHARRRARRRAYGVPHPRPHLRGAGVAGVVVLVVVCVSHRPRLPRCICHPRCLRRVRGPLSRVLRLGVGLWLQLQERRGGQSCGDGGGGT